MDFSQYAGRPVLITGGLGFIGSNLAARLVEHRARVLLVDSLIPEYGGNLFNVAPFRDRVRINICDIRDANGMNYLVPGHDFIFNLAGQVSHLDSMNDPLTDLEINCRSQLVLLETIRRTNPAAKIVFASTRQIYGRPQRLPVDESHPLNPTDVNGINKISGEMYHLLYNKVYGIRAVSLRLTNTYGPRQLVKHNRQGFIGWFVRQAVEKKRITLFGDGSQRRDFTYVDDVVDAFLRAGLSTEAEGEAINLGADPPYSLLDFTKILLECAGGGGGHETIPFPAARSKIDIGDYYADFAKARRLLGWAPATDLKTGLEKTVKFYSRYLSEYV